MTERHKVSIVIPTLNEESTVGKCLNSLTELDYPKESMEIIFSDGGSTDRTTEIIKEYRDKLNLVIVSGGTRAKGCNSGIKAATGDYIVFTDADCTFERNWLKNLLNTLVSQSDESIVSVGGPNITPKEDKFFSKAVGYVNSSFWGSGGSRFGWNKKDEGFVDHNSGCNVVYKKKVLDEVGGFDESLKTAEDLDLDFRLTTHGYKLYYSPKPVVYHWRRPDWKKFSRQYYYNAVGKMQLLKKHGLKILAAYKYMPYHLLPLTLTILILFISSSLYFFLGAETAAHFLLLILLVYLTTTFFYSLLAYKQIRSWKTIPTVFLLYILGHLSWLWGLLRGILPYKSVAAK